MNTTYASMLLLACSVCLAFAIFSMVMVAITYYGHRLDDTLKDSDEEYKRAIEEDVVTARNKQTGQGSDSALHAILGDPSSTEHLVRDICAAISKQELTICSQPNFLNVVQNLRSLLAQALVVCQKTLTVKSMTFAIANQAVQRIDADLHPSASALETLCSLMQQSAPEQESKMEFVRNLHNCVATCVRHLEEIRHKCDRRDTTLGPFTASLGAKIKQALSTSKLNKGNPEEASLPVEGNRTPHDTGSIPGALASAHTPEATHSGKDALTSATRPCNVSAGSSSSLSGSDTLANPNAPLETLSMESDESIAGPALINKAQPALKEESGEMQEEGQASALEANTEEIRAIEQHLHTLASQLTEAISVADHYLLSQRSISTPLGADHGGPNDYSAAQNGTQEPTPADTHTTPPGEINLGEQGSTHSTLATALDITAGSSPCH